jgi:hypothetical protein
MLTMLTIQASLRIIMATYVILTYEKLAMLPNIEATIAFTPIKLVTFYGLLLLTYKEV